MTGLFETRRRWMALALACALPGGVRAQDSSGAPTAALLRFDALYIPALFFTGSAGNSMDGPARAVAAMKRLVEQWPALRPAMDGAVADRKRWPRALQAVQGHLRAAETLVAQARWPQAHEALERVREVLFDARRSLGIDYALDEFTAYHAAMERVAVPKSGRAGLEADFATARALWRNIERMSFDADAYALSPARARQLEQARLDESNALSALSEALHAGKEADVLKAAAAIKPPFVRAYVSFGAPL
jgi:hypothetical protein